MKNKKFIISISLASGIFVAILLFDLLSKHLITKALPNTGDSMEFIPNFINFIYVENTGAAWGMLSGRPVFLIVVSLIILGIYLWFYVLRLKKLKNNTSITLGISVGLIVGGCIGNLVDRIAFGYVRDFINFEFIDFPVFNIADIALTIGIIIMLIYFIFIYAKEDKKLENITVQIENFKDMSEINKFEISAKRQKDQNEIIENNNEKKNLDENKSFRKELDVDENENLELGDIEDNQEKIKTGEEKIENRDTTDINEGQNGR